MHALQSAQDKKKERQFFDNYVSEYGNHDLCVPESYSLVLQELGLDNHGESLKILDMGCGAGLWSKMLMNRGYTVWGFDLSLGMAKAGKARTDVTGKLHPFVGDIEFLAAKSGTFDLCFGAGILHHLPSLSLALPEIKRVLKEGGRFCFFEPNGSNPLMRLSYILRIFLDRFVTATGKITSVNEQTHGLTFYEKQFHSIFSKVETRPIYIELRRDPSHKSCMSAALIVRNSLIGLLHWILPARFGCNLVLITGKRK